MFAAVKLWLSALWRCSLENSQQLLRGTVEVSPSPYVSLKLFFWDYLQVNEEASDKVLEVEQKYNEVRRPVYNKRNQIIQNIPDFWLTAVRSTDS